MKQAYIQDFVISSNPYCNFSALFYLNFLAIVGTKITVVDSTLSSTKKAQNLRCFP